MFVDTIFSWIRCFKNNNWTYFKARWGIYGKISQLILIGIIYILNRIFKIKFIIYIVLYYFIFFEIGSILENYSAINPNLPEGLVEVLKNFQKSAGNLLVDKIKKLFEKFFGEKMQNDNTDKINEEGEEENVNK